MAIFNSYVSLPEGNSGVIPHFSTAVLNISMMAALVHCILYAKALFFDKQGQGDENWIDSITDIVGTDRQYPAIKLPEDTLLPHERRYSRNLKESLGSPTMSRRCLLHLWPSSLPFCLTPRWLLKWLPPTNSPGGHEIFHDFHLSSRSFVFHTLG